MRECYCLSICLVCINFYYYELGIYIRLRLEDFLFESVGHLETVCCLESVGRLETVCCLESVGRLESIGHLEAVCCLLQPNT